jgi:hypothetical protein
MNQYQYMFNACRVPIKPSDTTVTYDPSKFHHVLVARKGKFYVLDTVHPEYVQLVRVRYFILLQWNPPE